MSEVFETWIAVEFTQHGAFDPEPRLVTSPDPRQGMAFSDKESAMAACEADFASQRAEGNHDQPGPIIWHDDSEPPERSIYAGQWVGCYPNHGDRMEQFPAYYVLRLEREEF